MENSYIVICDDEYDIRTLMKEILEDEGLKVLTVSNSE